MMKADVVVCGGGPAGISAAIAAARAGCDTLLIEREGCLGGIWTSGLMSWILDCQSNDGILQELIARWTASGAGRTARGGAFLCEPEAVKLLLEEVASEAGVRLLYHCTVCGATVSDGRLTEVAVEGCGGRFSVSGGIFIDATGNGDLAARAGCSFDLGHPETGALQPMSLIALVDGLDQESAVGIDNSLPYRQGEPTAKEQLLAVMHEAGIRPSYGAPSLWHIERGLWIMMTNHAYGADPFNPESQTRATVTARRELNAQVSALRRMGGRFANLRLLATAAHIGVREGRRVHGLYTVSLEDVENGRHFDDAVCHVTFGLDVHPTAGNRTFDMEHGRHYAQPYDIPMRSLIARDVDGLLLAGRCISGDFFAHSSYRVTGCASRLGESAGIYAAKTIKERNGTVCR